MVQAIADHQTATATAALSSATATPAPASAPSPTAEVLQDLSSQAPSSPFIDSTDTEDNVNCEVTVERMSPARRSRPDHPDYSPHERCVEPPSHRGPRLEAPAPSPSKSASARGRRAPRGQPSITSFFRQVSAPVRRLQQDLPSGAEEQRQGDSGQQQPPPDGGEHEQDNSSEQQQAEQFRHGQPPAQSPAREDPGGGAQDGRFESGGNNTQDNPPPEPPPGFLNFSGATSPRSSRGKTMAGATTNRSCVAPMRKNSRS